MRGFIVWLCVLPVIIWSQLYKDLLLPAAKHIIIAVVDTQGEPISDADVYDSNDTLHSYKTDAKGGFDTYTQVPALVIRKAGYRSGFVRTQNYTVVRVTLAKLARPQFPACPATGSFEGLESGRLRFRGMPEVRAGSRGRDIDYATRTYYVEAQDGPKGTRQGAGPLWSLGAPSDWYVWRSVAYAEEVYDFQGLWIIDARGTFADGSHWRSLGMLGETATYSNVDPATARILDRFMDGACLQPRAPRQ